MNPTLRTLILPGVLSLVAFAILISLGNWQMDRLTWKEKLVAQVAERPAQEALTIENELLDAAHAESFFDDYEYRRARLIGRYAAPGEVLVFTSLPDARGPFGGPGYWVLTPFVTVPESKLVYVNRGFVPEERKRSFAAPPEGQVVVQGLIRAPEKGSWFTPEADVEQRVFFARHPHRIAEETAFRGEVAGLFLDLLASETPPGGLPQAGETRMTFTNNHLGYAFTWYGLAAALVAVFASFAWSRLRSEIGAVRLTPTGPAP